MENIFNLIEQDLTKLEPKSVSIYAPKPNIVKDEALRLYLEGVSYSEIARRLGLNRKTPMEWAIKGGWIVKRQKLRDKAGQTVADNVREMRDRHIKIAKAIQAAVINEIRSGTLKLTATDGLKSMEHEARLLTPENYTTQINNNISPESFISLLEEAKREDASKQRAK
jgi:transposase-like protein